MPDEDGDVGGGVPLKPLEPGCGHTLVSAASPGLVLHQHRSYVNRVGIELEK